MKSPATTTAFVILLLAAAGCSTTGVESRIQEKSALFNSLQPWQQKNIQAGVIEVGNSTDIAYLALGKPSQIITSADGQEVTWRYTNYIPLSSYTLPSTRVRVEGGANYSPVIESPNAPGSKGSLSSTGIKGTVQTNLDVPDLPTGTLFVTFRGGVVYDARFDPN